MKNNKSLGRCTVSANLRVLVKPTALTSTCLNVCFLTERTARWSAPEPPRGACGAQTRRWLPTGPLLLARCVKLQRLADSAAACRANESRGQPTARRLIVFTHATAYFGIWKLFDKKVCVILTWFGSLFSPTYVCNCMHC